jgi:hypothetical protein
MMKKNTHNKSLILSLVLLLFTSSFLEAQQTSALHTRGKLWETIYNWGFIGDPGAWDYLQVTGIGFYPGFKGFNFPTDEFQANGYITDANCKLSQLPQRTMVNC